MDIQVSRIAELLLTDAASKDPELQKVVKKYRKKTLFDEIVFSWTDFRDVFKYELEDYEELLKNLPAYIEKLTLSDQGLGAGLLNASGVKKKKRLL